MSKVTFHDTVSVDVAGTLPAKGSKAPAFSLVNAELGESTLATYAGKRKVLNIFPSVDTGVCATPVRRFNTVVLCISGDLPFAQNRFCGAEGLKNVVTLSCFRSPAFRKDYGVDMTSGPLAGLTARAVVVLDENDQVLHSELVSELTHEPDYAAALAVL